MIWPFSFRRRTDPDILSDAYFTASQSQLIWTRFKAKRSALIAGAVLVFLLLCGILAPFLSPYQADASGRDADYVNGPPQLPQFCDDNGCSLQPFIHEVERHRGADTNFRWVIRQTDQRTYMTFLPKGWEYKLFGLPMDRHLFGVETGYIHLFGTDSLGKDIFARTLTAIGVSMAVGTIGVLISFILALAIGGVAGYFGGWVDLLLQALMDVVKTIPTIPMFMALAAFMPQEWSAETRFFFISLILGAFGWGTLARRVRTHVLAERTADYVRAAQMAGAGPAHVIRRHLLPSFTSYIIVDLVISFPYMILGETGLSFIGLGLKDPVNSLGVMLQNLTRVDVMLNYPWYFIPLPLFVILVLSFVFVGDGLRDAADPYAGKNG